MARASSRRSDHRQGIKDLVALFVELFRKHNLLTYATAVAFRALIALVAFALLLIGVLGEIGREDVWSDQIAPQIAPRVLLAVFAGVDATVRNVFASSSVGLIAFAGALTVWQMSSVVRTCMGALALIYEEDDDRPWWVRFPISIVLGLVLTVGIVGAVLLATAARTAVHGAWGIPFSVVRWLLAIVLIAVAFGALVRYAPVRPRATRWASGGATIVVIGWVVESLIFAEYLRSFADWKSAVGSLLGVYFLTTFLYVGAVILMVGIEVDEQLRRSVAEGEERGILELVREVL